MDAQECQAQQYGQRGRESRLEQSRERRRRDAGEDRDCDRKCAVPPEPAQSGERRTHQRFQ
jgi:hypothetical protein